MEDQGLERKTDEGEGEIELRRRLLREAFGDDSSSSPSSDDDNELSQSSPLSISNSLLLDSESDGRKWVSVKGINGLWLCSNFLSSENQASLLYAILQEGWFSDEHNQAMRFGDLPKWALELSSLIREAVCAPDMKVDEHLQEGPLPSDLLWREPLFDQLIANVYKPGEGICSHVDLLRFEDGIAIISLESSCVMQFTLTKEEEQEIEKKALSKSVPVFLNPGSLVLMSGEARYLWKHGINRESNSQVWGGQEIEQKRRTSVTLRKLCTGVSSSC
ncbi:hypothetical protein LUZ60_015871 [Juncus effusus]|nr:hypothetical protein LUZ60_015871 [Juncus effusus]